MVCLHNKHVYICTTYTQHANNCCCRTRTFCWPKFYRRTFCWQTFCWRTFCWRTFCRRTFCRRTFCRQNFRLRMFCLKTLKVIGNKKCSSYIKVLHLDILNIAVWGCKNARNEYIKGERIIWNHVPRKAVGV